MEKGYVETIIQNCDGCDMLFFGMYFHMPDGKCEYWSLSPCVASDRQEIMEQMQRVIAKSNVMSYTFTKVYCRRLLIGMHFIEGLSRSEDIILTHDCLALARNIKWTDDMLYHYRACRPTSLSHRKVTTREEETIARETARLSHLFADGYGVSESLRDMAGTSMLLYVIGHRGFRNIIEAHRKARAFCKAEGLRMPYRGMLWPVIRRAWQKLCGR